ncbi:MAG: helix-turn-helix domain-containing protein [Candidatus Rhabdochlamydia sp.]
MENNLDTSIKVVTLPQAAAMLGMSPLTIRRAIQSKKIKAMQISPKGRYRILIEELYEFIERSSQSSQQQ